MSLSRSSIGRRPNSGPIRATPAPIRRSRSGRSPTASGSFGFTNPVLIDDDGRDHRRPRPGRGRQAAGHRDGARPSDLAHLTRGGEARLCHRRQQAGARTGRLGRASCSPSSCSTSARSSSTSTSTLTGFETAEIDLLSAWRRRRDAAGRPCCPDLRRAGGQPARRSLAARRRTGCSAAMPRIPQPLPRLMAGTAGRSWSSPIRPTTCRSTAMSAASGRSGTASSRWRPAR